MGSNYSQHRKIIEREILFVLFTSFSLGRILGVGLFGF